MAKIFKKLSPSRIIALGFASLILIGSLLLIMPFSVNEGVEVRYIDALYISTSAVCVTGLVPMDPAAAFTPFGQFILIALIQIGGLGVTTVGAFIIIAMGKKINIRGRNLIKEASNLDSGKGIVKFIRNVVLTTAAFELVGAVFSFAVFIKDYPLMEALGHSLFHSISSFNNAGFDNLGSSGELYSNVSLLSYRNNVLFNITTSALIIFGGIGFLVISEVISKKFRWKKFSMHTKAVLSVSAVLIVLGTVFIKLTEDVTWLGAFFHSVSTRTAGFSTYNLGSFSSAGLLITIPLMLIGASPGSTGGGIKTTTFFILLQGIKSAATNKSEKCFKYAIPHGTFRKAAVITLLAIGVVFTGTYLMVIMEPEIEFIDALFEITSAFGTVGLSTGITSALSDGSKILTIIIMYIGRLGPLTIATLWYFTKGERVEYPDGNIAIG